MTVSSRDYEKIAERQNKRQAKRAPLLSAAGVLQQRTADDVRAADIRFENKMIESTANLWQRGLLFRELTLRLSEPGTTERLDASWLNARCPHTCEYYADFWRQAFVRHAT